eukprot:3507103-Pyramimonas_sp.AAC.1
MARFLLLEACLERLVVSHARVLDARGAVWRQPWAVWTIVPRVGRSDSLWGLSWPVLEPSWDCPAA